MAQAGPPAPPALTAVGSSAGWQQSKANVNRILDAFRISSAEHSALYPTALGELPTATLTSRKLYEAFGKYILYVYKASGPKAAASTSEYLSAGSVVGYMSILLNAAADACRERAAEHGQPASEFFKCCLDSKSSSPDAKWWRGLKHQAERVVFQRKKVAGDEMDQSASPIYLAHIFLIVCAYARSGAAQVRCRAQTSLPAGCRQTSPLAGYPLTPTPPPAVQAALRIFSIMTCWFAAGRAAEAAWIHYDGMEWDMHFRCVFAEVPQPKTAKFKLAALIAGVNRHCCWYLTWADYLTMQNHSKIYAEDEDEGDVWLIPELKTTKSPGTKIGEFLKALLPMCAATRPAPHPHPPPHPTPTHRLP